MDIKKQIPEQYAIDAIQEIAERAQRRMLVIIIVLLVLLISCVGVIIWQRDQRARLEDDYETIETYRYEIEQEADDNSRNYFVGRDLNYGSQTESDGHGDEDPNP